MTKNWWYPSNWFKQKINDEIDNICNKIKEQQKQIQEDFKKNHHLMTEQRNNIVGKRPSSLIIAEGEMMSAVKLMEKELKYQEKCKNEDKEAGNKILKPLYKKVMQTPTEMIIKDFCGDEIRFKITNNGKLCITVFDIGGQALLTKKQVIDLIMFLKWSFEE